MYVVYGIYCVVLCFFLCCVLYFTAFITPCSMHYIFCCVLYCMYCVVVHGIVFIVLFCIGFYVFIACIVFCIAFIAFCIVCIVFCAVLCPLYFTYCVLCCMFALYFVVCIVRYDSVIHCAATEEVFSIMAPPKSPSSPLRRSPSLCRSGGALHHASPGALVHAAPEEPFTAPPCRSPLSSPP